jgi:hypothetical protein
LRAERLAVPPGEYFEQKQLHQGFAGSGRRDAVMPSAGRIVQTGSAIAAIPGWIVIRPLFGGQ